MRWLDGMASVPFERTYESMHGRTSRELIGVGRGPREGRCLKGVDSASLSEWPSWVITAAVCSELRNPGATVSTPVTRCSGRISVPPVASATQRAAKSALRASGVNRSNMSAQAGLARNSLSVNVCE
jgi:hypothetical protein